MNFISRINRPPGIAGGVSNELCIDHGQHAAVFIFQTGSYNTRGIFDKDAVFNEYAAAAVVVGQATAVIIRRVTCKQTVSQCRAALAIIDSCAGCGVVVADGAVGNDYAALKIINPCTGIAVAVSNRKSIQECSIVSMACGYNVVAVICIIVLYADIST